LSAQHTNKPKLQCTSPTHKFKTITWHNYMELKERELEITWMWNVG